MKNLPITADQSRSARFQLGLTQRNVIEESGMAGHKLKPFETGRFVPDMPFLDSLRKYYEGKGVDFTAAASTGDKPAKPEPGARVVAPLVTSRFVIDPGLPQERVDSLLDRMDANDDAIAALLPKATRDGFVGEFHDETEAALRQLFGLMAECHLLFRTLQGRNIFKGPVDVKDPKTLSDVVARVFKDSPIALPADDLGEPTSEEDLA